MKNKITNLLKKVFSPFIDLGKNIIQNIFSSSSNQKGLIGSLVSNISTNLNTASSEKSKVETINTTTKTQNVSGKINADSLYNLISSTKEYLKGFSAITKINIDEIKEFINNHNKIINNIQELLEKHINNLNSISTYTSGSLDSSIDSSISEINKIISNVKNFSEEVNVKLTNIIDETVKVDLDNKISSENGGDIYQIPDLPQSRIQAIEKAWKTSAPKENVLVASLGAGGGVSWDVKTVVKTPSSGTNSSGTNSSGTTNAGIITTIKRDMSPEEKPWDRIL